MPFTHNSIDIYTDGSCHTQLLIGGWAAILFIDHEKVVLTGQETDTTHNRMELTAVIKAVNYVQTNYPAATSIDIFSDSQYVIGLRGRKARLSAAGFTTNAGKQIQNADLVKELLALDESLTLNFTKIKAHQKENETVNHNIEVDKLARKIVRDLVGKSSHPKNATAQ